MGPYSDGKMTPAVKLLRELCGDDMAARIVHSVPALVDRIDRLIRADLDKELMASHLEIAVSVIEENRREIMSLKDKVERMNARMIAPARYPI